MRQIFPLGDYVRRAGDEMTGPLILAIDQTANTPGFLRLRRKSPAGRRMVISFEDTDGTAKALIRTDEYGNLVIGGVSGTGIMLPGSDLATNVTWRPYPFPASLNPRRVMMVESRLFGRR